MNSLIKGNVRRKINNVEVEIKCLTVKEMPLVMQLGKMKEDPKSITAMISLLDAALPRYSKEEIEKFSIEYIQELMDAIMEVSNMKGTDKNVKPEVKG